MVLSDAAYLPRLSMRLQIKPCNELHWPFDRRWRPQNIHTGSHLILLHSHKILQKCNPYFCNDWTKLAGVYCLLSRLAKHLISTHRLMPDLFGTKNLFLEVGDSTKAIEQKLREPNVTLPILCRHLQGFSLNASKAHWSLSTIWMSLCCSCETDLKESNSLKNSSARAVGKL